MHLIGPLIIVLAVLVAVWFYQGEKQGPPFHSQQGIEQNAPQPDALELLNERYARGDISRQEYLQKKSDLEK